MKKRSLNSLMLNKKSISNLNILGGDNSDENPTGGSEHAPNSIDVNNCFPESALPDTRCTCA